MGIKANCGAKLGTRRVPLGFLLLLLLWEQMYFYGREEKRSGTPVLASAPLSPAHLTFICSHLGEQGLGHLGPFHLLLDLVVNGSCDVDVGAVHLDGEVCCRRGGFGLPRDRENNHSKSAAFSPAICAEITQGFQSADAKQH